MESKAYQKAVLNNHTLKAEFCLFPKGDNNRRLILECPGCKKDYETKASTINKIGPVHCKSCAGKLIYLNKKENYTNKIVGTYKYLREALPRYKTNNRVVVVKCIKKGCIHPEKELFAYRWIKGYFCPCDSPMQSKGVSLIKEFLNSKLIPFVNEYVFSDCKMIRSLRFDFKLDLKGITYLIEYNGKQHYEIVSIWGGKKSLDSIQLSDEIKTSYCKEKNIKLLTIHYKNINKISQLLKEFLNV